MQRVVLVVLALTAVCLAIQPPTKEFRKQLAGPPSEFPLYAQPSPVVRLDILNPTTTCSTMIESFVRMPPSLVTALGFLPD